MFFSEFKRTVVITDRKGREYQVRMLPVSLHDDYIRILEETTEKIKNKGDFALALANGRKKLRTLAMTVLPKDLHRETMRLDYDNTATLLNFLFYGSPPKEKPKKDAKPEYKELDYHFLAAKILAVFPGYTLGILLDEPTPVFFKLFELATRMNADRALNELLPAIASAFNNEMIGGLQEIAGDKYVDKEVKETYTDDQLQAAVARMHSPDLKTVKEIRTK